MKSILSAVVLLTLALFTFACATTPAAPAVKGTLSSIEGSALTVTPADGQPVQLKLGFGTQVFWSNGEEASGTSVLVEGLPVEVWTKGDVATKVVIATN